MKLCICFWLSTCCCWRSIIKYFCRWGGGCEKSHVALYSLFLQPTGSTVKRPQLIPSSCSEGSDV